MRKSMRLPGLVSWIRDAKKTGTLLCALGLFVVWLPGLLTAALGVEMIASAFWLWARAAPDAAEQVPRWAWVRRPALALWLGYAIHAALPPAGAVPLGLHYEAYAWIRGIGAGAIVWAGLELLAALPLARTFSDLPGPFLEMRAWLPVLLPVSGFAVLWRQAPYWLDAPGARPAAITLLSVTAVLAALRAFTRRPWTATLRWLVVTDCALAGMLVAGGTVSSGINFLLWLGACGAHVFLLAGELRGSAPRRGTLLTRLWRTASWVAVASLAWPTLVASAPEELGRLALVTFIAGAITTALVGWLSVSRMVHAEERRRVMRPDPALTMSHIFGIIVLMLGPLTLARAFWSGFRPDWRISVLALAPVTLGAWGAIAIHRREPVSRAALGRERALARGLARGVFSLVVRIERQLLAAITRISRWLTGPVHDLHTGDAQEYLLFVVGLAVLAVVLPLLR